MGPCSDIAGRYGRVRAHVSIFSQVVLSPFSQNIGDGNYLEPLEDGTD